MSVYVTDSGYEPSWYVNDLFNLVGHYCLTWREPLLTNRLYGVLISISGMQPSVVFIFAVTCAHLTSLSRVIFCNKLGFKLKFVF